MFANTLLGGMPSLHDSASGLQVCVLLRWPTREYVVLVAQNSILRMPAAPAACCAHCLKTVSCKGLHRFLLCLLLVPNGSYNEHVRTMLSHMPLLNAATWVGGIAWQRQTCQL